MLDLLRSLLGVPWGPLSLTQHSGRANLPVKLRRRGSPSGRGGDDAGIWVDDLAPLLAVLSRLNGGLGGGLAAGDGDEGPVSAFTCTRIIGLVGLKSNYPFHVNTFVGLCAVRLRSD